ncbi:FecCD family ABC transporter permease [Microvirga arsenatis]|uniref:Iron chelate uptake ABC transporter family permease subunit n=1 Tax=Microvirga arsenatis TaxID=2692265 RepID=A0ABW9YYF8_9HYPH|nr:iron ABC transporter permease [Microvirga arsenatis]NBJ09286.1 iron chelate uptake ABC transporter family permease subunit [Microvirga arsenatis]NBJ23856.1 iron chelate uptake ABC transporter family permease subunit [Microvirga arsenatis]
MPRPRSPLIPCLAVLIGALSLGSLLIGPAPITAPVAVKALVSDQGAASVVVREIRLPRTWLALMIGWIFGLSGAALQGLLRNPLADTAVFGAPQASAFGAVLVIYSGLVGTLSWALPVAAILGALLSIGLVVLVAGRGASVVVLVLAGLAVGSLAGAGTSLAISLSPNPFAVTEIVFWLLGSFEDRSATHVLLAAPFVLLASLLILQAASGLRALSLGEETALSLGVDVARLRGLIVAGAAIGTGASVAVAGSIGFVGLVAPHLVRPLTGYDPARTLVPAGLAGAALLLAGDCAARLIPSGTEVKVGVLTALLGVPFFLWVIARRKAELLETPA